MEQVYYRDLGNGITGIDTLLHRPGLAACYLIEHGGMAGFIDTGTNNSVPVLLEVLQRKGIAKEDVAYVMPTHVHLDHAGGAGGLMGHLPNATLLMHPRGARHMIDPSKLEQGSLAVYGEAAFAEIFGRLQPVDECRVQQVADEFELDFNGRKLVFLDAPGHARHHYCIWDEASEGLFTGDTFGASYPELNGGRARFIFPPTTPVQFDPDAWFATLDRLMQLKPKRIFVTHFGMHEDIQPLEKMLRHAIADYADTAKEYMHASNRTEKISNSILQSSVNYLLDQQCGVDVETIRSLLIMDMQLNAQGLDHWLDLQR